MTARIHSFEPESIGPDLVAECLTQADLERAARFRFPADARHWSACRATLRCILGNELGIPGRDVPIVISPLGKPTLAAPFVSLHFNLSHCPDLALVAVGNDGPLGIDLELASRAPDLLECESQFCHPLEIESLPADREARAAALLHIWTAKEAVLKALGTGLSHPPESFRMDFTPAPAIAISNSGPEGMTEQNIHRPDHPSLTGYVAALSAPRSVTRIEHALFALSTAARLSANAPSSAPLAHG